MVSSIDKNTKEVKKEKDYYGKELNIKSKEIANFIVKNDTVVGKIESFCDGMIASSGTENENSNKLEINLSELFESEDEMKKMCSCIQEKEKETKVTLTKILERHKPQNISVPGVFTENWQKRISANKLFEFFTLWFDKDKLKGLSDEDRLEWFKTYECDTDIFKWLFEHKDPKEMSTELKLEFVNSAKKAKKQLDEKNFLESINTLFSKEEISTLDLDDKNELIGYAPEDYRLYFITGYAFTNGLLGTLTSKGVCELIDKHLCKRTDDCQVLVVSWLDSMSKEERKKLLNTESKEYNLMLLDKISAIDENYNLITDHLHKTEEAKEELLDVIIQELKNNEINRGGYIFKICRLLCAEDFHKFVTGWLYLKDTGGEKVKDNLESLDDKLKKRWINMLAYQDFEGTYVCEYLSKYVFPEHEGKLKLLKLDEKERKELLEAVYYCSTCACAWKKLLKDYLFSIDKETEIFSNLEPKKYEEYVKNWTTKVNQHDVRSELEMYKYRIIWLCRHDGCRKKLMDSGLRALYDKLSKEIQECNTNDSNRTCGVYSYICERKSLVFELLINCIFAGKEGKNQIRENTDFETKKYFIEEYTKEQDWQLDKLIRGFITKYLKKDELHDLCINSLGLIKKNLRFVFLIECCFEDNKPKPELKEKLQDLCYNPFESEKRKSYSEHAYMEPKLYLQRDFKIKTYFEDRELSYLIKLCFTKDELCALKLSHVTGLIFRLSEKYCWEFIKNYCSDKSRVKENLARRIKESLYLVDILQSL